MTTMNQLKLALALALLAPLAVAGCDSDDPVATDSGTGTPDAAADTGTGDDAGSDAALPGCAVPTASFGTEIGRNFEPLTLADCDGVDYDFYGADFCDTSFTVVSIAAGWCGPCIMESRVLTDAITEAYRADGVRVIQILTQTDTYGAPDGAYCSEWVSTFGLTNIELIDPAQFTGIYFPGNALPAALIVDSTGQIVYREYGYAGADLAGLTAKLDQLLAAP
ncbi:MAG: hypothetical protein DRJ42_27880 [Deltaproteobacteria bacterium]|nr:MAG: hypothetical protein DRJ42_27880 [Deltaproteobacteria bacterium]